MFMKNVPVIKASESEASEPEDSGKSKRSKRLVRYIPENTYSINDHEETFKNETVEPKDSEGSDRSEITEKRIFRHEMRQMHRIL